MSRGSQYSAATHKATYQLLPIQLRGDGERRSQTLATVIGLGERRYTNDYGVTRAVLLYF